jgi:ubiquinone/menaquinone biosynthesis C-methylase UbiE
MGPFSNLGFDNSTMDVEFISQAFHHSSQPKELLKEINRVLKPGGKLIMIGQNYIGGLKIIIKYIKYIIRNKSLIAKFSDLFPSDDIGDHY